MLNYIALGGKKNQASLSKIDPLNIQQNKYTGTRLAVQVENWGFIGPYFKTTAMNFFICHLNLSSQLTCNPQKTVIIEVSCFDCFWVFFFHPSARARSHR